MKKLLILYMIVEFCSCITNSKLNKNNEYSLMKPIYKMFFQVRAKKNNDSVMFCFFDSLKQKIDTSLIKGVLFVKYKNKEELPCSLIPIVANVQCAIVPEWEKYDVCQLNVFYKGSINKVTFYNERESWDKKKPLIAPWRGMF